VYSAAMQIKSGVIWYQIAHQVVPDMLQLPMVGRVELNCIWHNKCNTAHPVLVNPICKKHEINNAQITNFRNNLSERVPTWFDFETECET
jgi:hypothetical protein